MALDQPAVAYLTKKEVRQIDRLAVGMNMSRSQAIRVAILAMLQRAPANATTSKEAPFAGRRQRHKPR